MGRRYQVPKQQLDVISAGQKEVVRSEGGLYPAVDQRWLMMMADDENEGTGIHRCRSNCPIMEITSLSYC